jgi:hypothetical protein
MVAESPGFARNFQEKVAVLDMSDETLSPVPLVAVQDELVSSELPKRGQTIRSLSFAEKASSDWGPPQPLRLHQRAM